ncbi:hypothetical protein MKW94_012926 [Papaver nudicaule]|uniref:Uncharacterized protein n=1 Tax=Papaver nudicaule TaxID=74823 RepID=A0AA41S4M1_PAPNU|nr:hypothetical protein [Papaver nudicaule]
MDESWRMRMGLNNLPRRRSTEETSSDRLIMMSSTTATRKNSNNSRIIAGDSETSSSSTTTSLDPENFSDVFGGPPRSIISRQFSSGDLITGNLKYKEIFRSPDYAVKNNNGKKLLPSKKKKIDSGFYDDIFGSDDDEDKRIRSKWKSLEDTNNDKNKKNMKKNVKSSSSSVLSWEGELSPLRPSVAEDDGFFDTFTSKLRPVNIPGRRPYTTSSMLVDEQHQKGAASDYPWIKNHHENNSSPNNHNRVNAASWFAFSHSISSPDTISIDPNSCRSSSFASNNVPKENGNPGESPASSVVSLQREYYPTFDQTLKTTNRRHYQDYKMSPQEEEEDHEELMRSCYVIEIGSEKNTETRINKRESVGIDEAIAWAKEKFQSQCAEIIEEITNHQQQQLQQQISLKSWSPTKPTTQEKVTFFFNYEASIIFFKI